MSQLQANSSSYNSNNWQPFLEMYDSSLCEGKTLEGDDAVKDLIPKGIQFTSAVCVMVDTDTWPRRWVK